MPIPNLSLHQSLFVLFWKISNPFYDLRLFLTRRRRRHVRSTLATPSYSGPKRMTSMSLISSEPSCGSSNWTRMFRLKQLNRSNVRAFANGVFCQHSLTDDERLLESGSTQAVSFGRWRKLFNLLFAEHFPFKFALLSLWQRFGILI